jgi:uncharacterized membrane protein
MDIRFPIGFLFTILGIILTILGFVTQQNEQMYVRSLGRNVNLQTGLLMLVFGSVMLLMAYLSRKKSNS